MKDVELGEDVGHAGLLSVHGGGDVQSANCLLLLHPCWALCSYTLVSLARGLPRLRPPPAPNSRRLCAVTAPQNVADPAVAGTCVPSTASTLRE